MVPPSVVRHALGVVGVRVSYLSPEPSPDGAPLIVLIHGSGVSARYWWEQLEGLADVARVLALDLPGHGESDPLPAPGVEAQAETVGAVIEALDFGLVASLPARAEPEPRRPGLGTVRRLSRRAIGWLRQRWRRGPGW